MRNNVASWLWRAEGRSRAVNIVRGETCDLVEILHQRTCDTEMGQTGIFTCSANFTNNSDVRVQIQNEGLTCRHSIAQIRSDELRCDPLLTNSVRNGDVSTCSFSQTSLNRRKLLFDSIRDCSVANPIAEDKACLRHYLGVLDGIFCRLLHGVAKVVLFSCLSLECLGITLQLEFSLGRFPDEENHNGRNTRLGDL